MITQIKIQNFRAFQGEVQIRVRPLTVLIGKNSAGKSSAIKFLLMLKQTLESQADPFFVTEGSDVHLGTWKDLRHTRTRDKSSLDKYLRFSIEVVTDNLPSPDIRELWKTVSRSRPAFVEGDKIKINLEFDRQPLKREIDYGRFVISGEVFYGRTFKSGRHEVRGFVGEKEIFKQSTRNLGTSGFLNFARSADSVNKAIESIAVEPFLEVLRYEFLSQRHLSPVRERSEEVVQTGSPPPGYVGHNGEYAIPHLVRILSTPQNRKKARREDKTELILRFAARVAGVDDLKFRPHISRLLTDVQGRNMATKALCSLADFGFGVSQCLPIFIQGAMQDPQQLLIVEQPEAQLHPTAQLELGSYFSELWTKHRVPSLIETHSGNIVLRLRRLVKQGALSATDVSVAFFTVEENKSGFPSVVVKNLDVNPDGSISEGLPMEFFGADVLEALEMGS